MEQKRRMSIKFDVNEKELDVFTKASEIEGLSRNQLVKYVALKYCRAVVAQDGAIKLQDKFKDISDLSEFAEGIFADHPEMIEMLRSTKGE